MLLDPGCWVFSSLLSVDQVNYAFCVFHVFILIILNYFTFIYVFKFKNIFNKSQNQHFFLTFKNSFIYSCVPDHTKYSHGIMTDGHLDLIDTFYGLADIGPGLNKLMDSLTHSSWQFLLYILFLNCNIFLHFVVVRSHFNAMSLYKWVICHILELFTWNIVHSITEDVM